MTISSVRSYITATSVTAYLVRPMKCNLVVKHVEKSQLLMPQVKNEPQYVGETDIE